MNALYFTLGIPLFGTLFMAAVPRCRIAGWVNVLLTCATTTASVLLAMQVFHEGPLLSPGKYFHIDAFNVYLLVLTAFVATTTAIFSRPYMEHEFHKGRVNRGRLRLYHAMYQGFVFTMLLALSTNNLGILWVALEGATLATVLLVSLYRTPESIEAAWKYFILCGVGIALALFGTVLLYFSAASVLVLPEDGLLWSRLHEIAGQLNPTVMKIAFVFLLVGYGTKVGLVPLHAWLPDAHSEGPTPMSAVLSGLLLNVALYAIVRTKVLVDAALLGVSNTPQLAGYLMMAFGFLSFVVAGFFLHRQRDIKRLFSYSSIEHMGLMTFAFGLGGPLATFAGLLHMTLHSLIKSSIFVTVGHATHIAATQSMEQIRGLIRTQPAVGWGLVLGTAAIAGFPPFGLFVSEFLLLIATMKAWPWLSIGLLMGLLIAFAGLFRHIQPMVYGAQPEGQLPVKANMLPVYLHLGLTLWLGLALPDVLAQWFDQATRLISGSGMLP